jgi:hypothetical protein
MKIEMNTNAGVKIDNFYCFYYTLNRFFKYCYDLNGGGESMKKYITLFVFYLYVAFAFLTSSRTCTFFFVCWVGGGTLSSF